MDLGGQGRDHGAWAVPHSPMSHDTPQYQVKLMLLGIIHKEIDINLAMIDFIGKIGDFRVCCGLCGRKATKPAQTGSERLDRRGLQRLQF